MNKDTRILKECNKILKKWIEETDEENIKNYYKILKKMRNNINYLLENMDSVEENEILTTWINENYEDCKHLRNKIEWESLDYFYYHYTRVPVSIDKLQEFYRNESCYCGNNCIDESE